jgi:hypothetical protein
MGLLKGRADLRFDAEDNTVDDVKGVGDGVLGLGSEEFVIGVDGRWRGERKGAFSAAVRRRRLGSRSNIV